MNQLNATNIRAVLLNTWDPIGVQSVPQAHDEYDFYIVSIKKLLTDAASTQLIVENLLQIEQSMGLKGDPTRALSTAERLQALIQY